jgi:hypothetical protein
MGVLCAINISLLKELTEIFGTVSIEDLRTAVEIQRGYGPLRLPRFVPRSGGGVNSHF